MPKALAEHLRKTWGMWLALIAIAVLGTWHLSRQPHVQNPILPAAAVKMEPHIELQFLDVAMQGREKGTVRWRIEAPLVSASQNQQYIYFEKDPHGSFYNLKDWSPRDGAPPRNRTVDWKAKKAEYDSLMEAMTITGSASFTTQEHDVLATETVVYRTRDHQIVMDDPVVLKTHAGMILRAHEASADTEMEQLQLAGNVELISPLKGQEKPL